jgi:hypothetical protein
MADDKKGSKEKFKSKILRHSKITQKTNAKKLPVFTSPKNENIKI